MTVRGIESERICSHLFLPREEKMKQIRKMTSSRLRHNEGQLKISFTIVEARMAKAFNV